MKPLFIVFEGLDGSGKSTQAELLQKYYLEQNHPAVISPEPTSGPIGKFIRNIFNHQINLNQDKQTFERQMSYLFAADRHYHLYNQREGILKLLEQQKTIISTRYYFSSFAYHCQTLEDWELVRRLNQEFPEPDLLIYLDIPLEICWTRLQERSKKEMYENQEKLKQVRTNYQCILGEYRGVQLQLDATETKEAIHQNIVKFIVDNFLNNF